MKKAVPMILSEDNFKQIFAFVEQYSKLAKALYNAALFRIRQVFTGWDKKDNRTPLEQSVFDEIECAKEAYGNFSCRRVLSYPSLDKILRANRNPDFFAGLPMQTAQSIVRQAVTDFKAWLEALKAYKKDPSFFTGKPKMPGYCKADKKTFKVTNQDAALYPTKDGKGCLLKLPKMDHNRIPLSYLKDTSNLREIVFKPYYGKYIMKIWHHLFTLICRIWQEWICERITSQLSHAQTARLLYTRAVLFCPQISSLPSKRHLLYLSLRKERNTAMRPLHF